MLHTVANTIIILACFSLGTYLIKERMWTAGFVFVAIGLYLI